MGETGKTPITPTHLKALRASLGYTQAQLAQALAVSRVTVSRWEMVSGAYPITHCVAEKLHILADNQERQRWEWLNPAP